MAGTDRVTERTTDELNDLLQRASGGDEIAFKRFYDLTASTLLALLMRMLKDRFQAEDVLQDAMVTAWNRAADFDPSRAGARTWITMIARRRALDLLRSSNRRQTIVASSAFGIREVLGQANETAERTPESSATESRLAECFGKLNSDAATCIRSAYLDGLTFSEIAVHVGRSLGTVKSWIRRGMVKLQACMQR